jgi:hypothetical protein
MKIPGILSILLLAAVCGGCASAPRTIPTGEWSGTGAYADVEMTKKGDNPTYELRANDNSYATTLSICEKPLYGHSSLYFDIRSQRGKLMNIDGEESHVTFTIVKMKTLQNGTELYALIDFKFNQPEREIAEEDFRERMQIVSASCMRREQALVLQVNYIFPEKEDANCFWDTFTFSGSSVRKTGRIVSTIYSKPGEPSQEKTQAVDWTEELQKDHQ